MSEMNFGQFCSNEKGEPARYLADGLCVFHIDTGTDAQIGKAFPRNPDQWDALTPDDKTMFLIKKGYAARPHSGEGWTRVEDGLPEEEGYYIVTMKRHNGSLYTESNFYSCGGEGSRFIEMWGKVIAWQKLPAPFSLAEEKQDGK